MNTDRPCQYLHHVVTTPSAGDQYPLSRSPGRELPLNLRPDLLRLRRVLGWLRSGRQRCRQGVQEGRVHGVPVLRLGLL